jgi:hypothetical protein
MGAALQVVQGAGLKPLAHIFGVRHLSPRAALDVRRFLDERDPKTVLIEGPSDATDQLKHLAHAKTKPPVALLAFTKSRPVRTIVYPLAAYSPEWVALRWALEKKRAVRFIDLPASVFLALHRQDEEKTEELRQSLAATDETPSPPPQQKDDSQAYVADPYEAIAELAGEPDHDTWWERHFEHLHEPGSYRQALLEFGRQLRDIEPVPAQIADPVQRHFRELRQKETLLREAYMRRELRDQDPEATVVVCGAFHASVLTDAEPVMSDAEAKALPKSDCVLTLMPYSYLRLSAQSGYGAGNLAPAYFEAIYEEAAEPRRLPARYFAQLSALLRREGQIRSSAEVIEAMRLADGLAALNGSSAPALRDLRDAAVTLLGRGELMPLQAALRQVEIGTQIGTLPPGVSRTALQDDFHQLVKTLRLEKFLEDKEAELELDLREDRFAKKEDKAFLDRHRSTFLHRLSVLDVGFAAPLARAQRGTAKEKWRLRWTPECEIRLAERSLQADSIELCAAFLLAERLRESADVGAATQVLLQAASCDLHDALSVAMRRVQDLAVDDGAFASIGLGIANIAELIRYGSVRDVDPAPLRPILQQLYLRATLLTFAACVCADDAVPAIREAMDRVHEVAFMGEEGVAPEPWLRALGDVGQSDNRNPFLSGYATALLLERGQVADELLDAEVSRRLSPGTEASVGIAWFEGLVQRNRAALFMRKALWATLSRYVDALDDDAFRHTLLYLRRAFSKFDLGEVRRVVGLIAAEWQGGGQELARAVETKLDEQEIAQVASDLDGLDFDE